MNFKVGDTVVYPITVPRGVEDIVTRTIKGEPVEYLVLKVTDGDMTVQIPLRSWSTSASATSSVRRASTRSSRCCVRRTPRKPTNWARRFKANQEKLISGDIIKVAEIVRDLWRREQDRGLSAGEKRMLTRARRVLVDELSLARTPTTRRPRAFSTRSGRRLLGAIALVHLGHRPGRRVGCSAGREPAEGLCRRRWSQHPVAYRLCDLRVLG